MNTTYDILRKICEYFRKTAEESHNNLVGNDSYQYYHTSLEFVEKALNLIKSREDNFYNMRFLDVGSGIGLVCGTASLMGLKSDGVEVNPVLCEVSKQIFPEVQFHNIDARNFNQYENYDIVFYWLPFRDPKLMQEFKVKIEDSARVGSYIIVAEDEIQNSKKDDRFIAVNLISNINGIENKIWQKIKQ